MYDPTNEANFLIVGCGFLKNFLIFNKVCAGFFPSIINIRNLFFELTLK